MHAIITMAAALLAIGIITSLVRLIREGWGIMKNLDTGGME